MGGRSWPWLAVVVDDGWKPKSRVRQSAGLSLMNATSRQVPMDGGHGLFACGVRPYSPGEIDELAVVARSG